MGLLIIGALVIVGVFAYNKWQERRASRSTDEAFKSRHADVLMGGGRSASQSAETDEQPRIEPGFAVRSAPAARGTEIKADVPLPHPRTDYVIEMAAEEAISAVSLYEAWAGIEHRFPRRTRLGGWSDGQWVLMRPEGHYEKFRAALQLVSRQGVVSEAQVLEFRSTVETLAARLGLTVASPEMRDALDAARALDGICAEADIQIAFHVVADSGATFPGTKVRAAAEAAGLTLGGDGRFTLLDEQGQELYALSDRSGLAFSPATMKDATPQALTLSMDVPRAPETQRTFDAMLRFGKHLANLLAGGLVDDNNQPLDERAVSAINIQLAAVRRSLEEQGIAPGSVLALRLFS